METHNSHFGCFILPPSDIFVSGLDSEGRPQRQRRQHAKSRHGCKNCKERKIKVCSFLHLQFSTNQYQCDEKEPCQNCVKRSCPCTPNHPRDSNSTMTPMTQTAKAQELSSPWADQALTAINVQHLQLFYHFENFTSTTFVWDPPYTHIWKENVMALALQVYISFYCS